MYERQIAGKRIPNLADLPKNIIGGEAAPPAVPLNFAGLIKQMAVWDSYKLTQLTPDGFEIQKRTNAKSAWINVLGRAAVAWRGVRRRCFGRAFDRSEEFLEALADRIGNQRGGHGCRAD